MNTNASSRSSLLGSSIKPPGGGFTSIPVPTSVRRPLSGIPRPTTTKKPLSSLQSGMVTGMKRPSQMPTFQPSGNKFARSTPLSLKRTSSLRKLPIANQMPAPMASSYHQRNEQQRQENVIGTRLEFQDSFNTPPPNKEQLFLSMDDQGGDKKKELENRATSPLFSWENINKESELISLKAKNSLLEKEVADFRLRQANLRIEHETKEFRLKAELSDVNRQLKEKDVQIAKDKETETRLRSEVDELKKSQIEQSSKFQTELLKLDSQAAELKASNEKFHSSELEAKSLLAREKLRLNHKVADLEVRSQKAEEELAVYKEMVVMLKAKESEKEALQRQLVEAEAKIRLLGEEINSYDEGSKLEKILQSEISQYKQLGEENSHLRQQLDLLKDVHSDNRILKEKLLGLEAEIENLNALVARQTVETGELSYARKRLDEWTSLVGIDSPDEVKAHINELKTLVQVLRVENESLQSETKMAEQANRSVDMDNKASELEVAELKKRLEQVREINKKLNRKSILFSKERDSYKKVIASFESEVTLDQDDQKQARITDLERIVADYKQILDEQEVDLKQNQARIEQLLQKERESELLQLELETIKKANPNIYTSIPLASNTSGVSLVGSKFESLQTSEEHYRVMHLAENPLDQETRKYIEKHVAMAEEIERLRCTVDLLEAGGNMCDVTRQIDEGLKYRQEVEHLKAKIEKQEKNDAKLRESFRKTSREYRHACQTLFGYRLESLASSRFRLTPMIDQTNDSLDFMISRDGHHVQLLQNDASEKLEDLARLYLLEHGSYPAFLAAYTLRLFNSTTLV